MATMSVGETKTTVFFLFKNDFFFLNRIDRWIENSKNKKNTHTQQQQQKKKNRYCFLCNASPFLYHRGCLTNANWTRLQLTKHLSILGNRQEADDAKAVRHAKVRIIPGT